ncbi:hypothetical protein [Sedimenticola selenatireducens]|uniref:hypothetical protein n=1 Tax=Sedimenticola selenatireducens TaxID=191960 RepID=UPI0004AD730F|nr:hypothetical protein [Sedimenticola selenatireducens]
MKTTYLGLLIFIFPQFAPCAESGSIWTPLVQDYFMDILLDFGPTDTSAITVKTSDLLIDDLEKLIVYQDAIFADKAISPIDVYDVSFNLQGNPIKCTGFIVKRTDDINRIKNKKTVERARLVLLGNCQNLATREKVSINISKYVIFPRKLAFGATTGYERYRSVKNINTNDKILACVSNDSNPLTQGPRHIVAVYNTADEYILGWESESSSIDQRKAEYPVKINDYHDSGTIEDIKDTIQFFQGHDGRGQIVFDKDDCEFHAADHQDLIYLQCYIGKQDRFHPPVSQINAEIVMKKIRDARYLRGNSTPETKSYDYISTEVSISFVTTPASGGKRFSTGFEFRNSYPDSADANRECYIRVPVKSGLAGQIQSKKQIGQN